jgi:hypothetical protein
VAAASQGRSTARSTSVPPPERALTEADPGLATEVRIRRQADPGGAWSACRQGIKELVVVTVVFFIVVVVIVIVILPELVVVIVATLGRHWDRGGWQLGRLARALVVVIIMVVVIAAHVVGRRLGSRSRRCHRRRLHRAVRRGHRPPTITVVVVIVIVLARIVVSAIVITGTARDNRGRRDRRRRTCGRWRRGPGRRTWGVRGIIIPVILVVRPVFRDRRGTAILGVR